MGPKTPRLPCGARLVKRSRPLYKVPGAKRSVRVYIQPVPIAVQAMFMTDDFSSKYLEWKSYLTISGYG